MNQKSIDFIFVDNEGQNQYEEAFKYACNKEDDFIQKYQLIYEQNQIQQDLQPKLENQLNRINKMIDEDQQFLIQQSGILEGIYGQLALIINRYNINLDKYAFKYIGQDLNQQMISELYSEYFISLEIDQNSDNNDNKIQMKENRQEQQINQLKNNRQNMEQQTLDRQDIQQKLNDDDYIYIAKNSPCYKTICKFTIIYFICLIIVIVALVFNNNFCLLDAPIHVLKIANQTGPITYNGIITKNDNQTYKTYDPLDFDYISKFNFDPTSVNNSVYIGSQDQYLRANNRTGLQLTQFPLGIMINYTYVDGLPFNNTLKKLIFKQNDGQYIDDNGAAIEVEITNKRRKAFRTEEAWFNENYWEQYISDGSQLISDKIKPLSGCQFQYFSDQDNFTLLDSTNAYSQIPMWLINIDQLTQPKVHWCAKDYDITFYIHKYFCFSPLIIRQMNYQTIVFENIELHGQILFDTQIIDDTESQLKYEIKNSSIDYLFMSDCKEIDNKCYIDFNISDSNVTLFIPNFYLQQSQPDRYVRRYYNVVGQQRKKQGDEITFFKLQHHIVLTIQNQTLFKFENVKSITEIKDSVTNQITQLQILSLDNKQSQIQFQFEHNGDKIISYENSDVIQCQNCKYYQLLMGENSYNSDNEQQYDQISPSQQ